MTTFPIQALKSPGPKYDTKIDGRTEYEHALRKYEASSIAPYSGRRLLRIETRDHLCRLATSEYGLDFLCRAFAHAEKNGNPTRNALIESAIKATNPRGAYADVFQRQTKNYLLMIDNLDAVMELLRKT